MTVSRTKNISLEDVVSRLSEKGFSLVGEYSGMLRSHCLLRCRHGHEWNANVGNVLKANGTGCPHCSGRAHLTLTEIEKRLEGRGIRVVGENPKSYKYTSFECDNGHTWRANLGTVLRQTGCPKCRVNRPLTREEVNSRVSSRGYRLVGDYSNAGVRSEFECSKGHRWVAIPDNVLRGKGCPECAEYGFNPKYSASFYTIRIFSDCDDYIGFGITRDIQTRMSYHSRAIKRKGFSKEILDVYNFKSGHDAKVLEDLVKSNFDVVDTGIAGFRKEAIRAEHYKDLVEMFDGLKICA